MSAPRKNRTIHWRLGVVGVALSGVFLGIACADKPPPMCKGEQNAVATDGKIRVTTMAPTVDVTAKGALKGKPRLGERAFNALLLLDYSGSMYGGYAQNAPKNCPICKGSRRRRNGQPYYYGQPEFQALVANWLQAAAPKSAQIKLRTLLFNKALWRLDDDGVHKLGATDRVDFPWDLRALGSSGLSEKLAMIPNVPSSVDRRAANETHLKDALSRAVDLLHDDGLIWIITDNISDQQGVGVSAADAARNLEFYNYLHDEPRLQMVFAYPLRDKSDCTFMCGTSLFAYGIFVSPHARAGRSEVNRLGGNHLGRGGPSADGLLWNAQLAQEASTHSHFDTEKYKDILGVPLRLKPMDLDVVSVSFKKTKSGRGQPIRCKRSSEFGDAVPCVATLVVRNNLRHQIVESATLVFENENLLPRKALDPRRRKRRKRKSSHAIKRLPWASAACAGDVSIRPLKKKVSKEEAKGTIHIGPLLPGASIEVKMLALVPPTQVAPTSFSQLIDTAFTDTLYLDGNILARVQDIHTRLYLRDSETSANIYGAAQLPAIFRSHAETEVRASFPAVIPINNDGKLRALLLIGGLALLVLVLLLLVMRFQRVHIVIVIDGTERDKFAMPRVSSRPVKDGATTLGVAKRGTGGKVRFVPRRGVSARKQGAAWICTVSGSETRVELRAAGRKKRRSSSRGGSGGGF